MYKNVLNQYSFGLFLLSASCLLMNPAKAQVANSISSINYASSDANIAKISQQPLIADSYKEKAVNLTDTTFRPVRRLWGLAFGDLYYDAHADAANRGAETNYNGVPANRNAFQFRRIYLGYDYDINKKFTAEILLASEPAANTAIAGTTSLSNGDNLVDNKMAFYIKNFALRWKGVWKGSDLVIGEMLTPAFPLLTEKMWGYRSIERTIADFHRTNAYDIGVSLQGVFDPATKNFGYNVLVGNNSTAILGSAANANTGFYKAFYGDVYGKFFNQTLIFDLYGDYMQTAPSTVAIGAQARNMIKGFVAYNTPRLTIGLEAYTQSIKNGVANTITKSSTNATVNAFSVYTHGALYKDKLGFFARYDGYNPDTQFDIATVYAVNTNLAGYSPFTKEHFVTAGLDFTPASNVHFMPNVWFIRYKDQRDASTPGHLPDSHVLVYRATFFFIFGK